MSSDAKPSRPRFNSSFRSSAYPSKNNPFSDSDEEFLFDNARSTNKSRVYSFSETEEWPHTASSGPKSRRTGSWNEEEYDEYDEYDEYESRPFTRTYSTREYEDERAYPTPKDSFEDLRGEPVKDRPANGSSGSSSADPLSGVNTYVVAMVYIGISVTFRHIPESHVYALMERFLQEHHSDIARNIDQKRVKKIYDYMIRKELAGGYSDMDYERVKEFEEETRLSRFISRVKVETD